MFEHATDDPKKTQHVLSLDGAKERLHLFKPELMDEGCFDSIVAGCQGVFHTASPVFISAADPKVYPFHICFHFIVSFIFLNIFWLTL